jgi:cytosine/adenosine deaminase-related metal-dependent hydrolase
VGSALASRLGWPILDKDDVLDVEDPVWRVAKRVMRRRLGAIAYDVVWRMAERQLRAGVSAIVDTPLPSRRSYNESVRASRSGRGGLLVVSTVLDRAAWVERLEERAQRDPHTHKMKGRAAAERWEREHPAFCLDESHHTTVRTHSLEAMREDVEALVRRFIVSG